MFANAIAAERFRLLRDRSTLFWGFIFAPLVGFFLSIAGDIFLRQLAKKPLTGMPLDLVGQVLKALGSGASVFPALFLAIGAAAVLAGDYRWETWRLLTPRNSRPHLLGAKLVVVGEAILWNLVLTVGLTLLAGVIGASIAGKTLVVSGSGAGLGQIAGVFAVTWLEAMTLASLAAVIAVIARSPMGAVVAVVVVRFVQTILAAGLGAMAPEPTWKTLAIPAYSADLLRGFLAAPNHAGLETGPVGVALLVLLAWAAALAGGAILLFQRQDLTRE
ncbi:MULTISPECIES: ABC transporter permease [unclassified Caulobacter]|uniref:ABC transporter permease n=1 Tax=unclassified Caulobacter TaxID=2648921 RepID=UPI000D3A2E28|nr:MULTISPECIES: ABC transporter permease [unclassified Caulobacter]PTS84522.1 ABC transporter permease [Caulobacter sp. HMWF009]PTT08764.1 ABC transporter permease [Caulobacter sp. HMWF025]